MITNLKVPNLNFEINVYVPSDGMHWQKYINFYNKLFFPSQQTIPSLSPVLMSKLLGMDLPKWLTDYCTNFWPLSVIKNGKKCTQKTKLHLLCERIRNFAHSTFFHNVSEFWFEISLLLIPQIQNRPILRENVTLSSRFS